MNKKKWLTLGVVGTALLLIPRRSSRQEPRAANNQAKADNAKNTSAKDKAADN